MENFEYNYDEILLCYECAKYKHKKTAFPKKDKRGLLHLCNTCIKRRITVKRFVHNHTQNVKRAVKHLGKKKVVKTVKLEVSFD